MPALARQHRRMCNAKSQRRTRDEIAWLFPKQLSMRLEAEIPEVEPRYRIGPKGQGLILRPAGEGGIEPVMAEWSLMYGKPMANGRRPLWTNARAEGLTDTYPWKLLRERRCLSVADGFYEPEKVALAKGVVPWSFYQRLPRDDGSPNPFFMAGLWNEFTHSDTGETVLTYTIITVPANDVLRIHNRMPAMIAIEDAYQFPPVTVKTDEWWAIPDDDQLVGARPRQLFRVGDRPFEIVLNHDR